MKKRKGRYAIKHANISRIWLFLPRFIAYTALGFPLLQLNLSVAHLFEVNVKEFNMEYLFPLPLFVFLFALCSGAIIGSGWALWVTSWLPLLIFVMYTLVFFIKGWGLQQETSKLLLSYRPLAC